MIGDSTAPNLMNSTYVTWNAENSMVMTWLVNSMDKDINSSYSIAKELWDNINEMYFNMGN